MTLQAIITLAIAVLALTLKPGAGMAMVVSRSLAQGMKGCLTFMLGVNIINLLFLGLVLAGFHFIEMDLIFISILIKAAAAVYLISLGVKGLQNGDVAFSTEGGDVQNFIDNVTSAIILTASNPLVILFYAGILPTILDVGSMNWQDAVVIATVIVIMDTGVVIAYCLPLIVYRNRMSEQLLKKMGVFSSIIIILVGLYIGYSALPAEELLALF